VSSSKAYKISITETQNGIYYAGVYGSKVCYFNITLHLLAPSCPNKCSGQSHGSCNDLTYACTCNREYIGDSCNTMVDALTPGLEVKGYVGDNAWNYYSFNTFSSANAMISVSQQIFPDEPEPDCDLYVARDRLPTFLNYDLRDISFSQNFSLLVVGSAVNAWKIGIHGYSACNYILKFTMVRSCLKNCIDLNHGVCMDGTCACRSGWSGPDCSIAIQQIINGVDILDTISSGQWKYYQFSVLPGTHATIFMSESFSTGYIWLFANPSHQSSPSLLQHSVSDTDIGKRVHSIVLESTTQTTNYIIGVHGNALSIPNTPYEFSLVAYQPQF